MNHTFTEDELFLVMRLFMPEPHARAAAHQPFRPLDPEGNLSPDGELPDTSFTEDMLVLLSLQSPETAAKVEQYRAAERGGRQPTEEERAQWVTRCAQLEAWLESRPPDEETKETEAKPE